MLRVHAWCRCIPVLVALIGASAADAKAPAAEATAPKALLRTIQASARHLNYSGIFIYQQGSDFSTSRITHVVERGGSEIERVEILDGQPREYLRRNGRMTCYMPTTKTMAVEAAADDIFPTLAGADPERIEARYRIEAGMTGRVGGREAESIVLEPRDRLRYGYRLWADRHTGLLLRAQTIGPDGRVVEQMSFAQVEIGGIDPSRVRPGFVTATWRVEETAMSEADLSAWSVKALPPGFQKIRELKRSMAGRDAAGASNAAVVPGAAERRELSQIVYSDGLAAISVFIEPDTPGRRQGLFRQGALSILGKRQGRFWLTIVGEVPATTLRQVADSIEPKIN
ncbi:MAG: MucB/RseB C-terminal domain-containing protein [Burkholderiaceae bacterium]